MLDDLNKQAESLRDELIEIERNFNEKKEKFIRIQGAIEALQVLGSKEENQAE